MKKFLLIFMCFLLVGCGSKQDVSVKPTTQNQESQDLYNEWVGRYIRDDGVIIEITHDESDDDSEISFNIELGVKGFGNYAYLQDNKYHAIYDIEEDGHTLEFILNDNQLTVKESGGISYLNTDLSGEYTKQ